MSFKLKDIQGALNLLAAFKNADWVEEHLKALLLAKSQATEAIQAQKILETNNDVSMKALAALMADHKRQEESLKDRELRLKDAQQQHQNRMESELLSAKELRAEVDRVRQVDIRNYDLLQNELAARSKELDKREKGLTSWKNNLDVRERALDDRATALDAESQAHADKVRKLRELTA